MDTDEIERLTRELIIIRDRIRHHRVAMSALAFRKKTIIRELTGNGVPQAEIADYLGVSPARVNQVLHGKKKVTVPLSEAPSQPQREP